MPEAERHVAPDPRVVHEAQEVGDVDVAERDELPFVVRELRAGALRAIGLEIRAGVHTGEVKLSGGDVQGIVVHIGARIAALADAGDVFVSSTVKDLVAGSGIEFDDRGAHELKGVPGGVAGVLGKEQNVFMTARSDGKRRPSSQAARSGCDVVNLRAHEGTRTTQNLHEEDLP
jgi:class 3 adenylate cyclase